MQIQREGCFCSSSVNLANILAGAFANYLYVEEFTPDQFKDERAMAM